MTKEDNQETKKAKENLDTLLGNDQEDTQEQETTEEKNSQEQETNEEKNSQEQETTKDSEIEDTLNESIDGLSQKEMEP